MEIMTDTRLSNSPTPLSKKQQQELDDSLESEPSEIPLGRFDLQLRFMVRAARKVVTQWTPRGPSAAGIPQTHGPLEKIDVIPGVLAVPTLDEDGEKVLLVEKALFRSLRSLPLNDDATPWPSRESASKVIAQFEPILPAPAVQWTDVTSDRTMALLAFQGLAAHRLEPLDADPEGAAYVVDLSWMHGLAVRPGLEPYGACAYFAADRTLLRVYTSHDDSTYHPGDASWEEAKWRWRCALFTAVTVADHLGTTHYLASNLLVTVTRERLPENHPLRRFLKPYGYGAVDINLQAALTLSPEGALAHRCFSFTYAGLSRCLLKGVETVSFHTFPQTMAAKRIEALGDAFPYATDGLVLYAIFQTYAKDYLDIFFPGETLVQDPAVRAWWQGIVAFAPNVGLGPLNKAQQIIDLVTQLMFTVTGFHGQVGSVSSYLLDPAFISCKIRAGSRIADIRTTVQVLNLAAFTALEQPTLIGDYTHLFLEQDKQRVVSAFGRYQQALSKLSHDIDERNKHREQPFQTFNPTLLDTSVST
jgi:hypothetical protein